MQELHSVLIYIGHIESLANRPSEAHCRGRYASIHQVCTWPVSIKYLAVLPIDHGHPSRNLSSLLFLAEKKSWTSVPPDSSQVKLPCCLVKISFCLKILYELIGVVSLAGHTPKRLYRVVAWNLPHFQIQMHSFSDSNITVTGQGINKPLSTTSFLLSMAVVLKKLHTK